MLNKKAKIIRPIAIQPKHTVRKQGGLLKSIKRQNVEITPKQEVKPVEQPSNIDIPNLIVVGYYTLGTPYAQEAQKLIASCKNLGLEHDIVGVSNLGNWQANTRYKAEFVLNMLIKHGNKRLLYVDCDAVIHKRPILFASYSADIAVRYQDFSYRKNECLSGTIYMENNLKTKRLCEKWIELNKNSDQKTLEQVNLGKVIEDMCKNERLVFKNLPPEYTFIFDSMRKIYPGADPVIEHFQASRKLKFKV